MDAESWRFFSTRKLTTGCLFLGESSHHSIVPRHTADRMASRSSVRSENQSFWLPSSSTYCSEPTPTVRRLMPSQSTSPRLALCSGGSCRNVLTRNAERIPIGTLMKKHQFQV